MKKALLSIAGMLSLTVMLVSCQGGSPKDTAEKFLNGFYHMDYASAKKVADSETIRQVESWESVMGTMSSQAQKDEAKKIKVSIKDPVVKDTTATVEYSTDKEPTPHTLKLVKRNGKWLAQWSKMDVGAGSGGMAPDQGMNNGGLNNGGTMAPDTVAAPPADGTMNNNNGSGTGTGTMDNGGAAGTGNGGTRPGR